MMLQRTRKSQFITNDRDCDPSIRRHLTRGLSKRQSGSFPWEFSVDSDGQYCRVSSINDAFNVLFPMSVQPPIYIAAV